jgi:hypothetical protein
MLRTPPRSAASTAASTIDFASGVTFALSTSKNTTIVAGTSGCGAPRAPANVVTEHTSVAAVANHKSLDANLSVMAPPLAGPVANKTAEDGFFSLNAIPRRQWRPFRK